MQILLAVFLLYSINLNSVWFIVIFEVKVAFFGRNVFFFLLVYNRFGNKYCTNQIYVEKKDRVIKLKKQERKRCIMSMSCHIGNNQRYCDKHFKRFISCYFLWLCVSFAMNMPSNKTFFSFLIKQITYHTFKEEKEKNFGALNAFFYSSCQISVNIEIKFFENPKHPFFFSY